jgi:hypothetical protein
MPMTKADTFTIKNFWSSSWFMKFASIDKRRELGRNAHYIPTCRPNCQRDGIRTVCRGICCSCASASENIPIP